MELAVALLVELKDFLPRCSLVVRLHNVLSEDIIATMLGVFEKSSTALFDHFALQSFYLVCSIAIHSQPIYYFLQLAYFGMECFLWQSWG